MCEVCGCGATHQVTAVNMQTGKLLVLDHDHEHAHSEGAAHAHHDPERHAPRHLVEVGAKILAKNNALAAGNRAWLDQRRVLALNLMSAPGAGKTTLLERTIRDLGHRAAIYVVEGDQATSVDGERVRKAGATAVQVNTGTGCHLDAHMIRHALLDLDPKPGGITFIENVGNLVCPALFDVGEHRKIAMLSVTEGDDKPLKYPHLFAAADLVLINKIDLLAHVDFEMAKTMAHIRTVNPDAAVIHLSVRAGRGLDAWYAWVGDELAALNTTGAGERGVSSRTDCSSTA
jgi:hydrogenase nickel incorporation protein HypB